MVLTHLILNGMIKVKGQLGEIAKCVDDPEKRISDLARLFFAQLSTKDMALYNNLQDVISHLSVGKWKVEEEAFESTMKYIFGFIEKVCIVVWNGVRGHADSGRTNKQSR
jgi:condensin complex subunit 1